MTDFVLRYYLITRWLMFVWFLLCGYTNANMSVVTKANNAPNVSNCIMNISKKYFQPGHTLFVDIVVTSYPELDHLYEQLHLLSIWPITQHYGTVQVKPESYILLLRNTSDLSQHIQHGGRGWNSRAKYLVVLTDVPAARSNSSEHRESARVVLQHLWTMKAVNVVVLTSSADKSWDAYTWFPYRGADYCAGQDVQHVVLVDRWSSQEESFTKNADLYPNKVPNNLLGCPLIVSTFDWPPFIHAVNSSNHTQTHHKGLEIELLRTIVGFANLTLSFKWGRLMPVGTWDGTRDEVLYGRADASVASYIDKTKSHELFDVTSTYMANGVVWLVPRARRVPNWKSLLKVFNRPFCTVVAVTFLVASIVLWFLSNVPRDRPDQRDQYTTLSTCFSNAFAVMLGVTVAQPPTVVALRFFFVLWTFYCLQINTAYQSKLISVLTEPGYEKQISNMDELAETDYVIDVCFDYDVYLDEDIPTEKILKNKISTTKCPIILDCLKRVAEDGNYALLADDLHARFLIRSMFVDKNRKPLILPFKRNVFTYLVGMLLQKDSILSPRFNVLIGRINQAGLMVKWQKDVVHLEEESKDSVNIGYSHKPMRLTTSHLQGAFIVLVLGMFLSSGVFVLELIAHCFHL